LKVPELSARWFRVRPARTAEGEPALEIDLRIDNRGPGDAWGVRAVLSSAQPELNRRVLYAGHVPAGDHWQRVQLFPIGPKAEARATARVELTARLLDAHGAAPTRPITAEASAAGKPGKKAGPPQKTP
jgi:hypothetical protein